MMRNVSSASEVLTNDLILDTLYEHIDLGSWMRLFATSKGIKEAYLRMLTRNLPESRANQNDTINTSIY